MSSDATISTKTNAWINDINNGGANPEKLTKDGEAFAQELATQIADGKQQGKDTSKLEDQLTVVKNATASVKDNTYNQQATQSAYKDAVAGKSGQTSDQRCLASIADQCKAAISKGGDMTGLRDNLGAFVNQQRAAGRNDVADAAQKMLDSVKSGDTKNLSGDMSKLQDVCKKAGITMPTEGGDTAKKAASGSSPATSSGVDAKTGTSNVTDSAAIEQKLSGLEKQIQFLQRSLSSASDGTSSSSNNTQSNQTGGQLPSSALIAVGLQLLQQGLNGNASS